MDAFVGVGLYVEVYVEVYVIRCVDHIRMYTNIKMF